jgi:o-succinylbenzoate synthase
MNLASFDLYYFSLPLRGPLVLRDTTLHRRQGVLLRLSGDDGSEGWGESAPLPGFSAEDLDQVIVQLRRLVGPLIGREVTDDWTDRDGAFGRKLERIAPVPSVRFGLELAVWNLCATSSEKSLPELFAGQPRVLVNGLLSGSWDEVLEEAQRMKNAGYEAIKLKVGARTVAEDATLVRKLVVELGDTISLRLDANRAWGYEQAAEFLGGAPRFEYLEEPLADPARLPRLVREFGAPVALDESLVGMEPGELEEHRYARAVVLKPTLLGGIEHFAHGRAGASSRHDARHQLGLRERRRDGGPRCAGSRDRRAPCTGWPGHVSCARGRRSRHAARPAGPERGCR